MESRVAVLTLGFTKGGKRLGVSESVTLTHEVAVRYLRHWLHISTEGQGFCSSAARWRTLFATGIRELHLQTFDFRPYSLRRGGATWYFSKFGSLDRVMLMGRWQAARTARIYLNEGLATLAEMHFAPQKIRLAPFHLTFKRSDPRSYQTLEPPKGRSGGRGKGAKGNKRHGKQKPRKARNHKR